MALKCSWFDSSRSLAKQRGPFGIMPPRRSRSSAVQGLFSAARLKETISGGCFPHSHLCRHEFGVQGLRGFWPQLHPREGPIGRRDLCPAPISSLSPRRLGVALCRPSSNGLAEYSPSQAERKPRRVELRVYSRRVTKVGEVMRRPSGVAASTRQRRSVPAGRSASASAGSS